MIDGAGPTYLVSTTLAVTAPAMTATTLRLVGSPHLTTDNQPGYTLWVEGERFFWGRAILDVDAGKTATFGEVLMHADGKHVMHGSPFISGAKVTAEVLEQRKDKKVIAFKFKRRKGYHRTVGHRRKLTRVKIKSINVSAKKSPAKKNPPTNPTLLAGGVSLLICPVKRRMMWPLASTSVGLW